MNFIVRWYVRGKVKEVLGMTKGKTWLGGIGMILTGAGLIVNALYTGHAQGILGGWLLMLGGLTALGVGHKMEKQANAISAALKELLPKPDPGQEIQRREDLMRDTNG